jgi:hypothetical protein
MRRLRARRDAIRGATAAAIGRAVAETLDDVEIRHQMRVDHHHHHDPLPQPVRVYAEIANMRGELWRVTGFNLAPGERHVALQGVPIAWITGRDDDVPLGQAGIALRFEWPS